MSRGFVLLLVTYGHLLQEPLYNLQAHIFPRTILLVTVLVLAEDCLAIDEWRKLGTARSLSE